MKSNKGFTLVEMIIVIAIIGVVSSIGYTIINNSNNLMNENKITNDGQQSIKILNKYLSKDLEQCKNIIINGVPSNNVGEYSISLEINDGSNPLYLVKIYKYRGKLCYQITRQVNRTNIVLVENQIISSNEDIIPLEILKSGNIYEVKICYGDNKKIKNYNFKVSSRYSEIILGQIDGGASQTPETPGESDIPQIPDTPVIPDTPEIDEEMDGQNGFIRVSFDGNTVTGSIGSSKLNSNGTYTTYNEAKLDNVSNTIKSVISISAHNNNGYCGIQIDSNNKTCKVETQQKEDFGQMEINQINLVIDGDITYDIKVEMKGANGGGQTSVIHNQTITEPGKYEFAMPTGKDITVTGIITKKDNSTGKVVLTFGTKQTN